MGKTIVELAEVNFRKHIHDAARSIKDTAWSYRHLKCNAFVSVEGKEKWDELRFGRSFAT